MNLDDLMEKLWYERTRRPDPPRVRRAPRPGVSPRTKRKQINRARRRQRRKTIQAQRRRARQRS